MPLIFCRTKTHAHARAVDFVSTLLTDLALFCGGKRPIIGCPIVQRGWIRQRIQFMRVLDLPSLLKVMQYSVLVMVE